MYNFVNSEDVYNVIGITVNDADISNAAAIIETYAGVDLEDVSNRTTSDLKQLKKAVAFQAAFMQEQTYVYGRPDATSLSQDGFSIGVAGGSAFSLAPLAKACLQRCSWNKQISSVRLSRGRRIGPLSPYISDEHPWRSI